MLDLGLLVDRQGEGADTVDLVAGILVREVVGIADPVAEMTVQREGGDIADYLVDRVVLMIEEYSIVEVGWVE